MGALQETRALLETLIAFPTVQFYDGRGANRPWMQEFPDTVTKAVWNAWVEMHPETAGPLGIETGDLVQRCILCHAYDVAGHYVTGLPPVGLDVVPGLLPRGENRL